MDQKLEHSSPKMEPIKSVSENMAGEVYDVTDQRREDEPENDIAAGLAQTFEGGQGYSQKEVQRLRWKLDIRLIPLLWFNILLPAMDKVSHGTAALYGLKKDIHLVGDQYSWIGSIFYVSLAVLFCPLCKGGINHI